VLLEPGTVGKGVALSKLDFGKSPVDPSFWFLEAGLYHTEDYRFDKHDDYGFDSFRKNLLAVVFPNITIDVYSPACQKETVFVPVKREIDWLHDNQKLVKYGVQYAHFKCSRQHCGSDLYFVFSIESGVVTKIGQMPSIADLIKPQLRKYSRVLASDLLADWQRAVGLRAHGIGAGSYVYLRRVIEQMVSEASKIAIKDGRVDRGEFEKSRWSERIKLLAGYLPQYLVDNSNVYAVLSKGVHELSEAECTDYFDVMHTSIEIICEEKLAELERQTKANAGAKALQKVLQSIGDNA
jgi:hypothetical protein